MSLGIAQYTHYFVLRASVCRLCFRIFFLCVNTKGVYMTCVHVPLRLHCQRCLLKTFRQYSTLPVPHKTVWDFCSVCPLPLTFQFRWIETMIRTGLRSDVWFVKIKWIFNDWTSFLRQSSGTYPSFGFQGRISWWVRTSCRFGGTGPTPTQLARPF